MREKADLYFCPKCQKNITAKKCRCGCKGIPVHPPFERDVSKDPSYLDHVLKKRKNKDSEE